MKLFAPSLFRNVRFWLTLAAVVTAGIAIALPPIRRERKSFNLLAVIDITGSMNTRDYQSKGRALSRLDVMKDGLRRLLSKLPCGSRFGAAVSTERRPFLLFEPVEVCGNFAGSRKVVATLQAGSRSVVLAGGFDADLIFMSDGQGAPPVPWVGRPHFEGESGLVKG